MEHEVFLPGYDEYTRKNIQKSMKASPKGPHWRARGVESRARPTDHVWIMNEKQFGALIEIVKSSFSPGELTAHLFHRTTGIYITISAHIMRRSHRIYE